MRQHDQNQLRARPIQATRTPKAAAWLSRGGTGRGSRGAAILAACGQVRRAGRAALGVASEPAAASGPNESRWVRGFYRTACHSCRTRAPRAGRQHGARGLAAKDGDPGCPAPLPAIVTAARCRRAQPTRAGPAAAPPEPPYARVVVMRFEPLALSPVAAKTASLAPRAGGASWRQGLLAVNGDAQRRPPPGRAPPGVCASSDAAAFPRRTPRRRVGPARLAGRAPISADHPPRLAAEEVEAATLDAAQIAPIR